MGGLGLGLGDFRFGTGALGGQGEGQSFNHPYQRFGFYGALGLGDRAKVRASTTHTNV